MTDRFGIVANVSGDAKLRDRARVWICDASDLTGRPLVCGLDKHGKPIKRRVPVARLSNFRAAWIPPNTTAHDFGSRSDAEAVATNLSESKP